MAVPTIPSSISLTNIQTEFGGSNPIAINEYYAGGTYVASGTANATSVSIPTSGTIAFSNFSGASAILNGLVKAFWVDDVDFGTSTAGCYFSGINNIWSGYSAPNIASYQFQTSNSSPLLDVRFQRTSGTVLSGVANNVWLPLNVLRHAYLTASAPQAREGFANVAIKYNANATIISSNICRWTCWAEGIT